MSIFDHTEQTKKEYIINFFRENKDSSFEEVFEKLKSDSEDGANKFEWLLNLKVKDLLKYKELRKIKKELIDDIEEYEKKLLEFLTNNGVGPSERGFSTTEILDEIGGNPLELRNLLNELLENNIVWSTGETQAKRWVLHKHKKQAMGKYRKG